MSRNSISKLKKSQVTSKASNQSLSEDDEIELIKSRIKQEEPERGTQTRR